jgi:hypothetical protein
LRMARVKAESLTEKSTEDSVEKRANGYTEARRR